MIDYTPLDTTTPDFPSEADLFAAFVLRRLPQFVKLLPHNPRLFRLHRLDRVEHFAAINVGGSCDRSFGHLRFKWQSL